MRVLKFGGTSVSNAKRFITAANIIESNKNDEQIAIVLSAPANVTNHLVQMINDATENKFLSKTTNDVEQIFFSLLKNILDQNEPINIEYIKKHLNYEFTNLKYQLYRISLLKHCSDNIYASVISIGERLCVFVMKELLKSRGHHITIINPQEKLLAIGHYLNSTVDIIESTNRIQSTDIPKQNIILMAGFIAGNEFGELVLLGRNGSDYSAAVLAVCLNANCCIIWTDVNGIYTCDPRKVINTRFLKSLSYIEAIELSYLGARILHPRTIAPLAQLKIPCVIKNIMHPELSGTVISEQCFQHNSYITGITSLDNIVMLNFSGAGINNTANIINRICNIISKICVSAILIIKSSSECNISFCITNNEYLCIKNVFKKAFHLEIQTGLLKPITIIKHLSIISIVGYQINKSHALPAKIFSALSNTKINTIATVQNFSGHSISVVVDSNKSITGMQAIHQMLFHTDQIIEVFLIGVGGVGSTLLKQIYSQKPLLRQKNINICVHGIANSKGLLLNMDTEIDLSNWESTLHNSNKLYNINYLNGLMKTFNLINPVIIDCTASQMIADQYVNFLSNGFHVITSNKKANTSSWKAYQKIRHIAIKYHRKFLYNTNVGAGLPIIENLQHLLNAGDKLLEFSGILSGSLSFIFGKLDEGISLSKATKMACEMGFTEPDPRDDLSGLDVARKLLILAREAGYKLELNDIQIKPILPIDIRDIKNPEQFITILSQFDDEFAKRVLKAQNNNKVLRFIGTIKHHGICEVKLDEVDTNHPLYKIKNGENALVFYSDYYKPIPLVIRGYGAGNAVTAAGIFADLFRIL
ncbi:MAG: bifunctional aspartate kinase/homoserine dehydrogenase I [Pantoea sp. Brub]|nr:bifunctional aspartate kinase/homoserine dehydrogenase I [Pantoea sp. Brub]